MWGTKGKEPENEGIKSGVRESVYEGNRSGEYESVNVGYACNMHCTSDVNGVRNSRLMMSVTSKG